MKWKFYYPWSMVKIGFWLWIMSDFHHLPSQKEVGEYDVRWIDDMQLMHTLYAFQKNPDPIKKIFDTAMAQRNQREQAEQGFTGFSNNNMDIPPEWINE